MLGLLVLPGFLLLALLLQVTVVDLIHVKGVVPDLTFLLVVFYAFLRGQREGAFWGFVAGLMKDFITGNYFGLNALSTAVAGYLVGWSETRFYKDSSLVVMVLTFFATMVSQLIYYLLLVYLQIKIPPGVALVGVVLPSAMYNALLVPLFYRKFYRLYLKGWFKVGQF
ncbi:rod shape-determining protein MreD [Desulfofundulus thermosubterraneus]|uniref:Rod shape-determining protein MreD n=1 Tax=Desulfofundulus thermosubterraneus DSM 16057 TaxID=1121432 RepID=A0A1M6FJN5_9FIRM|nr:rod shape-determining protein MreD [Desulfofundulus thermosubterraneus]SHI97895.1 rod shape-determining protein MreD [Desulfofundulus thermosubterraneus DSM 16057]